MLGDRRAVHHGRQTGGWGAADDGESIGAIRRAVELGITLFDTADVYGAGHGEEVLGIDRPPRGHRRFRDQDLEWLGGCAVCATPACPSADAQIRRASPRRAATLAERMRLLAEHDAHVGEQMALLQGR
jgi:Aldo/keto reductase family